MEENLENKYNKIVNKQEDDNVLNKEEDDNVLNKEEDDNVLNKEKLFIEVNNLKNTLNEKDKLIKNYYDQLMRLKAEFENYRKRVEKEKQDYLDFGKEIILVKQIKIIDILEQALNSAKVCNDINSIIVGIEMMKTEFLKTLKDEGIEEIYCEKFDHNLCEVIDYVENNEEEDGKIIKIYQKGYKMNGKLIRPVKVKVVKNCDKKL
ncbi:MAG: nucleotide exchange factor GrpE [Endomicrobium sp.]|jgi:molecular chaperone GrpE|nr:nucleotide exchange factor GrpE [Endomicrobium sp.]